MTSNTALTRDEIREKLIALIKEQLSTPDVIEDDMSFTKDLGADSLDVVDLVINIEESFELTYQMRILKASKQLVMLSTTSLKCKKINSSS